MGTLLMDALAFPADGSAPALVADDAAAVVAQVIGLFDTQADIAAHIRATRDFSTAA